MSEEWKTYEQVWASRFRENLISVTRDYNVSELSRTTGINRSSLSEYISGKHVPSAWHCVKIARGLGVPITDVIDFFY